MAKATARDEQIFPDVTLVMDHEEAVKLTQLLSVVAVDSPIDTYKIFESMLHVMEDRGFVSAYTLSMVKLTRHPNGTISLDTRK